MENKEYDFSKLFNIKKFHTAYVTKLTKEYDIGAGYLVFLKVLTIKEFHSQQELSEFIGCNKAHTSRIIGKMQEKGYVEVSQSKNLDSVIRLTKRGLALAKKVEEIDRQYVAKLFENIPQEDLETFKKVCRQIYINSELLTNL